MPKLAEQSGATYKVRGNGTKMTILGDNTLNGPFLSIRWSSSIEKHHVEEIAEAFNA